jgi:hypothetical protein
MPPLESGYVDCRGINWKVYISALFQQLLSRLISSRPSDQKLQPVVVMPFIPSQKNWPSA